MAAARGRPGIGSQLDEALTSDPALARRYESARGKGGFVRASWDEAVELAAAAYVHTIRAWGPDRIAGSARSRR